MLRTTDEAFKRMVEEHAQLKERLDKLEKFINEARLGNVKGVSMFEIHLLEEQLKYMVGYESILSTRIYRVEQGLVD